MSFTRFLEFLFRYFAFSEFSARFWSLGNSKISTDGLLIDTFFHDLCKICGGDVKTRTYSNIFCHILRPSKIEFSIKGSDNNFRENKKGVSHGVAMN